MPRRWLAIAALLASVPAAADPLDEVGLGAAATGMASARSAIATGAEASHANPAGVARVDDPEVLIGWQDSLEHLAINGHDAKLTDAHGTSIGLAIPLDLGRVRLAAGVALYLPDQYLARIQLVPIGEPQYVRFATAAQRVVIDTVAAIDLGDLAFGAGVSLLADAHSRDLTFDVGVKAGEKSGAAHLDIDLPIRAAPLVGVWWRPHRAVELAATFRGQLSLDLALDIRANVDVPGIVTGDATIALRAVTYFTPMRATLGAAVHPRDDLVVTADVAWERWSALGSGVPDLRVLVALDLAPPLVSSAQPPANFRDIVTPRLGTEWRAGMWRLRAGAAFLPSPVPPQHGITSFADGTRILTALGAGIRIPQGGVLTRPIDVDVGIAWQHVEHELVRKDPALQPGGAFSSGGDIVQGAISATVRF